MGTLKFNDIDALIDTSQSSTNPYQIVIGDPSTPLKVQPSIYLDSVYNSVFDSSTISTTIPTGPLTTPSVIFSVNGVVKNFSVVSMTQSAISPNYVSSTHQGDRSMIWTGVPMSGPIFPAGGAYQFEYSVVGTTGRTTLQALAVKHLKVVGKATNFTAQRDTTPFSTSLSGMKYIRSATFGGTADAVALDVNGPIGKLTFKRGLGDPTGVFTGKVAVPIISQSQTEQTQYVPATNYGVPLGSEGYPAHGLLGGTVRAKRIKSLQVGPANYTTQTAQNPAFVQTQETGYGDPLPDEPGYGPHQFGDHHRRLDWLGEDHGQPAQQRDQDGLQLCVLSRGAGSHPQPPAGSPGSSSAATWSTVWTRRRSARPRIRPARPRTATAPAPPGKARSPATARSPWGMASTRPRTRSTSRQAPLTTRAAGPPWGTTARASMPGGSKATFRPGKNG